MKNKFIKVATYDGETVWLNSANIVAITESPNPDYAVVRTNAVAYEDESPFYLVPGSPEVLIGLLGDDIILS